MIRACQPRDAPGYSKPLAFGVGRRFRTSPIRDVGRGLRLDWHTVKGLEQQYMREQLRRAGTPGPRVIGLDEVSIKKGHTYRIVVSDLGRGRLNTAALLTQAFGPLWDYGREGWARRFFEHWRAARKWQRLRPYEKFATMTDRHWDRIAAYCRPENKVALGFVEGLNNKIRVLQRRAYGLRDEEYLRLKILTSMPPRL